MWYNKNQCSLTWFHFSFKSLAFPLDLLAAYLLNTLWKSLVFGGGCNRPINTRGGAGIRGVKRVSESKVIPIVKMLQQSRRARQKPTVFYTAGSKIEIHRFLQSRKSTGTMLQMNNNTPLPQHTNTHKATALHIGSTSSREMLDCVASNARRAGNATAVAKSSGAWAIRRWPDQRRYHKHVYPNLFKLVKRFVRMLAFLCSLWKRITQMWRNCEQKKKPASSK